MSVTGKAQVAGVLGWPVGHSRSPRLHGYWIETLKLDAAYVPLPATPEDLPAAIAGLKALGFRGANVTAPHKLAAASLMDWLDESATAIGAVNTIVREDGALVGHNTDAEGFLSHLQQSAPAWHGATGPVCVLGAGGAARAAAYALRQAGADTIRLVNRDTGRAEALARDLAHHKTRFHVFAPSQAAQALTDATLLVNATSLGMEGQPPLPVDLTPLSARAVVYDLVYAPLHTPLLQAAAARGLTTVDGLGMLLHQAAPAFAMWFGVRPVVDAALRRHVEAGLKGSS